MRFAMRATVLQVLIGLAVLPLSAPNLAAAHADTAAAQSAQVEEDIVETPPTVFIEELVKKLRALATDSGAGDMARMEGLRRVLAEDMAIRTVQGFVLSRRHRKTLTPDQLDAYNEIFPRYISSAYASSIDELVTRQIRVDSVVEGRRSGDFIIRSKILSTSGEERAGLDWRVRRRNDKQLLVDVMVDGLSFNVERRAQFSAIVKNEGFQALLDHMNEVAEVTPG